MRKIFGLLLLAVLAGGVPVCAAESEIIENADQLEMRAMQLTASLEFNDEAATMAFMTAEMQDALKGQTAALWAGLLDQLGSFEDMEDSVLKTEGDYVIAETVLVFSKGTVVQRTVFDREGLVAGLFFQNVQKRLAQTETVLSADITEVPVTVDAGEGFLLDGLLTMPAGGKPRATVVLVHGSGPNDMDESIGVNKPFADLAHGLAAQGVAVLRYDKRTYAYGRKMSLDPDFAKLTVDDEVARDVVAAIELLKTRPEINPERIYLLGHSLGGRLLAYIDNAGADSAGYILMAASPRKLWELSAEQYLLLAKDMDGRNKGAAEELRAFAALYAFKARGLSKFTDAEALDPENELFGMSAYYLRHLEAIDPAALHLADGKPMLVLQGGKDRQVTMTDYELWREKLKDHKDVTFKLYPQLNHLMGDYTGEPVPFFRMGEDEYTERTPVAEAVINDIAQWLRQ